MQDTVFSIKNEWDLSGKKLNFSSPAVMGILNVTPDSFYDGGSYTDEEKILDQAGLMLKEGASIIDIGACSTRPGAAEINLNEELQRLLPAIQSVRNKFPKAIISADTYRAEAALKAVEAGADMINDIYGGSINNEIYSVVARLKVPYILMHIKGTPQDMQQDPLYSDVVKEVSAYFSEKITKLNALGIKRIILDPGFGFGKTVEHNFELLNNLQHFASLGYPVLAGLSRKSMINKVLNVKAAGALNGTTVLNTIALLNGASVLRVHDVKEAVEAVKLVSQLSDQK